MMLSPEERKRRAELFLKQTFSADELKSRREEFIPASREDGTGDTETAKIESAVGNIERFLQGERRGLEEDDQFTVEAIIYPTKRPAAFVRGGTYEDFTGEWASLNDAGTRGLLRQAIARTGRIESPFAGQAGFLGTGFVVAPGLLMTNRHVAEYFASGLGREGIQYTPGEATVDFAEEVDSQAGNRTSTLEILRVPMIHPYWDMALLEVKGLPDTGGHSRLTTVPAADLLGRTVVSVGYPWWTDTAPMDVQQFVFGNVAGVKRIQPGLAGAVMNAKSFDKIVPALTHDCSTQGGNSGSCVVDVASGKVVGLHFAGKYLVRNYAVSARDLARDARVAQFLDLDQPVAFDNDWEAYWQAVEGGEIASRGKEAKAMSQDKKTTLQLDAGATGVWNIPLQISVTIGGVAAGAVPADKAMRAPVATEAETEIALVMPVIYEGLETRGGYDPDFLGLDGGVGIPFPQLTTRGKNAAAKLEDGSTELKYHRFSLVVHKGRRLAMFTASNVDFRKASRTVDGKTFSRKQLTGLPKNAAELWSTDWRIPMEHQLPDVFFTKDRAAFDKGHLVRRDDVAYGVSFEDIQMANGDTYHTPNCSPQVKGFNQSTQGEFNWGDLEDLVQQQTKAETAIVLSGPVLAGGDRWFEGVGEQGEIAIRIPSRYWKIIVVNRGGQPAAYGFVLTQDLSDVDFTKELALSTEWKKRMESIANIEGLLNRWATFPGLAAFDQFESDEATEMVAQLSRG
jgi:endonuclease G, mitochondrial